jgi:two-component system response regulator DevR
MHANGASAGATVSVFVLDDHDVIHGGFRNLLDATPDLLFVGGATTAAEALAAVPALEPDVVVIDVNLPDGNGVQVCRTLRSSMPQLRCLIMTAGSREDAEFAALLAGAAGFLTKDAATEEMLDAIREAARDHTGMDRSASAELLAHHPAAGAEDLGAPRHLIADTELADLTLRQRDVLELVLRGSTDRDIAGQLGLAEPAVANQIAVLFTTLGLRRRLRDALDDASRIPRD